MKLKAKDFEVIELLRHGESVDNISKKLKVPKSTVYYHVSKLKRGGLIKGFRISFDYEGDGENSSAIILVSLDRTNVKEISAFSSALRRYSDIVSDAYGISGDWDFVVFTHGKRERLQSFIQTDLHSMQNVRKTSSLFIMKHLEF